MGSRCCCCCCLFIYFFVCPLIYSLFEWIKSSNLHVGFVGFGDFCSVEDGSLWIGMDGYCLWVFAV